MKRFLHRRNKVSHSPRLHQDERTVKYKPLSQVPRSHTTSCVSLSGLSTASLCIVVAAPAGSTLEHDSQGQSHGSPRCQDARFKTMTKAGGTGNNLLNKVAACIIIRRSLRQHDDRSNDNGAAKSSASRQPFSPSDARKVMHLGPEIVPNPVSPVTGSNSSAVSVGRHSRKSYTLFGLFPPSFTAGGAGRAVRSATDSFPPLHPRMQNSIFRHGGGGGKPEISQHHFVHPKQMLNQSAEIGKRGVRARSCTFQARKKLNHDAAGDRCQRAKNTEPATFAYIST